MNRTCNALVKVDNPIDAIYKLVFDDEFNGTSDDIKK